MYYPREREIYSKADGRCFYCGVELIPFKKITDGSQYSFSYTIAPNSFVIDHIVPKRLGGIDDFSNLVPSCWACNTEKRGKELDDWRWYRTLKIAGIPDFSEEQISWLLNSGLDIFSKLPPWHKFYFEEKGLQP